MRKELDYIRVSGSLGGNQDWFLDPFMKGGGCAAVTACDLCIYLAKHRGLTGLYPYDAREPQKEDYLRFSKKMKPYLHPRWQGIDTLDIYLEGIGAYWRDAGCEELTAEGLYGTASFEEAKEGVFRQIDKGFPIPFLLLHHKEPRLKDYEWHWFNLAGYEEAEGEFFVKAITYGELEWLDLKLLWNTGFEQKGGMILLGDR
ncbi:MAG: hypothetical protein HFI29_02975 [Lachnospiraceae bacterium]|jgi:hypothetical protein|nr:hypothetical protein [Lachnospiraceae bacterium]